MLVTYQDREEDNQLTTVLEEFQYFKQMKLNDFTSMEQVYYYVDAIVSSGSTEEARGSIFVLGNTAVGKSSLVQTLRKYCLKRTEVPKAVLTGVDENRAFLETRVLDLVENVELQRKTKSQQNISLEIRKGGSEAKLGIITPIRHKNNEAPDHCEEIALEHIKVSFVDFGGHTEYAKVSKLFSHLKRTFFHHFPKTGQI